MSHSPSEVDALIARIEQESAIQKEELLAYIEQYNEFLANEEERQRFLDMLESFEGLLDDDEEFLVNESTNQISISKFDLDAALAHRFSHMFPKPAMKGSIPPDSGQTDTSLPFTIYADAFGKTGPVELTDEQFKSLKSSGIQVTVPNTKVSYDFEIDKHHNPNVFIEELPQDDNDLLLTVMNIIENIASHSRVVIIETEDPIAAGIANAYVAALQRAGLQISYDPIKPFTAYKNDFPIAPEAPWFKAALAVCNSAPTYSR